MRINMSDGKYYDLFLKGYYQYGSTLYPDVYRINYRNACDVIHKCLDPDNIVDFDNMKKHYQNVCEKAVTCKEINFNNGHYKKIEDYLQNKDKTMLLRDVIINIHKY